MSASLRICNRCASATRSRQHPPLPSLQTRCLHTTLLRHANPLPVTGAGPPPSAPQPAASTASERVARKRAQAELLKQAKEIRASQSGGSSGGGKAGAGSALKRRFWKDVSVQKQDDGQHTINLDSRAVRTPITKSVLPIPASKPHLATAIALEWDVMTSAQQALKTHNIPLTSMASRAIDLEMQDEEVRRAGSTGISRKSGNKEEGAVTGGAGLSKARDEVVQLMLRYLETDTLLCWAPESESSSIYSSHDASAPGYQAPNPSSSTGGRESLHQRQVRTAQEIIAHLTSTVWPGVVIKPVLEENSIMPVPQPAETRAVIRGWLSGLGPWELAGLERAVLATKSLCVGTRLLVDWAEAFRGRDGPSVVGEGKVRRFGIEEAADACSLELAHQTAMWGEVEDTHDVDREDLRRQLGSVVLLVSGTS